MFDTGYLEKYADVLLWGLETARNAPVKDGDIILLRYDFGALGLVEKVYEKLLKIGANVVLRALLTPAMEKSFYISARDYQLAFIPPGESLLYNNLHGQIVILAPASLTHLKEVNPAKIAMRIKNTKILKEILDTREEKGEYSWTLAMYPTKALAEHAGISMKEYEKCMAAACFLDTSAPVEKWNEVYREAGKIKKRLNSMSIKKLRVESSNVDIEITQGIKRKWIGVSGHNIPSFEIFVSPDWRGTNGIYYADQPSFRSGNRISDIRIEFKDGEVSSATAEEGEKFLKLLLETDPGARRIGEFSLTDKRFSRINRFMANTLFDENFGGEFGNCHIALGSAYTDTYDGNPAELTTKDKESLGFNDSAIHWDIVNTEDKRVTAFLEGGGKTVIYESGLFTL